jgi:hypothetical protein
MRLMINTPMDGVFLLYTYNLWSMICRVCYYPSMDDKLDNKSNLKSKILLTVFFGFIILSVSASYFRFVILKDYVILAEVDCDPVFESCFVWVCESEFDNDEECIEDTSYYKMAFRNARNITDCNFREDCSPFSCSVFGEEGCGEILCTEETVLEYGYENYCTKPEVHPHAESYLFEDVEYFGVKKDDLSGIVDTYQLNL